MGEKIRNWHYNPRRADRYREFSPMIPPQEDENSDAEEETDSDDNGDSTEGGNGVGTEDSSDDSSESDSEPEHFSIGSNNSADHGMPVPDGDQTVDDSGMTNSVCGPNQASSSSYDEHYGFEGHPLRKDLPLSG